MKKIAVNIIGVFLSAVPQKADAQKQARPDSLFRKIVYMDSLLFDAFNKRDIERFASFFSKDLEFYHDKGGLAGFEHTVNFLRSNKENHSDLTREVVAGSIEVYPINNYGAVQIGSHRFCHTENGKIDCGSFKFVHLWKKIGNEWKITRVISYDH